MFIHKEALVDQGAVIGAGTRVWAFAHIVKGAVIGENCNVCDHTFVEGEVRIGNRVTLKCGVYLWNGIIVEDDVFIGPCATFTNDIRPRSRQYLEKFPTTTLRQGCTIGANSTILPGLTIGRWAMVGAGAVVTRSVSDFSLVFGNPAKQQAWICQCTKSLQIDNGAAHCSCGRDYKLEGDKLRATFAQ
jgi:acetyltransferase-like isoleucine patch superfamily enzyme